MARKKRVVALMLWAAVAVLSVLEPSVDSPWRPLAVRAETLYGESGWQVRFTEEEALESNFGASDLDEAVSGLQPGDTIIFTLNLKNEHKEAADWYMTNKVLYSLEDRSANSGTSGGAYTYVLTYIDRDKKEQVLFSSDTVGGESMSRGSRGEQGLHEATNALKDFFYLDTLAQGQDGKLILEIALDGETQGNAYQNTLADLQMNFAVALGGGPDSGPGGSKRTKVVKTGDGTELLPYLAAMGISGFLLLLLGIYSRKQQKKEQAEGIQTAGTKGSLEQENG